MNHIGLFAKYWEPGKVKTRLARTVGNESACEIYRRFFFHLIARHQATADSRQVVFSPSERESDFRKAIGLEWGLVPQSDGNLGRRMSQFFDAQFQIPSNAQANTGSAQRAAHKVVVIGADCPLLDSSVTQAAFDSLEEASVVIGPSEDGGYYLIGMKDQTHDVFSDVDWSTPSVLPQTIEHLERQKIEYRLLEPMNDIDDIEDLRKLAGLMASKSESDLDSLDRELLSQIRLVVDSSSGEAEPD